MSVRLSAYTFGHELSLAFRLYTFITLSFLHTRLPDVTSHPHVMHNLCYGKIRLNRILQQWSKIGARCPSDQQLTTLGMVTHFYLYQQTNSTKFK